MKSEHRHELKENDLAKSLMTFPDYVKQYGGRVLLALAIVVLVIVLIFQRINRAREQALQFRDDLAATRDMVQRVKNFQIKPGEVGPIRTSLQRILTDASDKGIQAEALVEQGELAWALASIPDAPAAATDPSLRPEQGRPELLRESREAYQKVVDNYKDYPLSVAAARFGLAAIAENEGRFDDAKAHYEAVKALGDGVSASIVEIASNELKGLEVMRKPLLVGAVPEKPETPPVIPDPLTPPTTGATTAATATTPATGATATTGKAPAPTTRPSGATTRPSGATTRPAGATTRPSAPTTRPATPPK